jgi:hypothetical protein
MPLRIVASGEILQVSRVMLAFIGLNQRDQDFQLVALRATRGRSPKRFDAPQSQLIIAVGSDGFNFHIAPFSYRS